MQSLFILPSSEKKLLLIRIDLKRIFEKIKKRIQFGKEFKAFKKVASNHEERFDLNREDVLRCMNDNTPGTGFDRHYIYHTSWAARFLKDSGVKQHVDISSTLYFCGIISAYLSVDFYDYRPANLVLSDLTSNKADLVKLEWESNSIKSLSCMHTVEHVGLGRYGDDYDYDGDLKAMKELARVLTKGGQLLFVVPVGKRARIQYNAHRVYTADLVISTFKSFGLDLVELTLIPEDEKDGGLVKNPLAELLETQNYACGCFVFTKSTSANV
ncbi:MAG: hypothetical protein ACI857_000102 [Arenicella sp.]|jgi:hypothetical protein